MWLVCKKQGKTQNSFFNFGDSTAENDLNTNHSKWHPEANHLDQIIEVDDAVRFQGATNHLALEQLNASNGSSPLVSSSGSNEEAITSSRSDFWQKCQTESKTEANSSRKTTPEKRDSKNKEGVVLFSVKTLYLFKNAFVQHFDPRL